MTDRTYKLPRTVYFQCIWLVKDLERLQRLELAADTGVDPDELVFFEVDGEAVRDRNVLMMAKFKMDCVRRALEDIPEEYRQGTIDSITYNIPYVDVAHENTWRKWRRVFIRSLASNLMLV